MNSKTQSRFQNATALSFIALFCFACNFANAQNSVTFTNPIAPSQGFGWALAAAAPDRVLIGDYLNNGSHGSVFLFNTNGTLVRSFHNPAPEQGIIFGVNLAMVGSNHFVSGAPAGTGPVGTEPGAAHLFHLDGTLVKTFADPEPSPRRQFGQQVAAIGNDRVLIAAVEDTLRPGVAYLFGTNGNMLTTITNPVPTPGGDFGYSMCVVGLNKLFISARTSTGVGVVHLFNTNGTLLKSYGPPHPPGSFGGGIAPLGGDRIVVGGSDAGATNGAIYSLHEDGTVVRLLRSPSGFGSSFGQSLAVLGNRLIIGAPWDSQVVLYEHCGNPIRGFIGSGDFGVSVAVVGASDILVGAWSLEGGYAVLFFGGGERFLSPLVESDFASGLDGWTSAPQPPTHDASSETVYLHEQANDGATNFWKAPAKFLGNKSGAYNGKLSFEQKNSQSLPPSGAGEIVLRGNGLVLVRSAATPNENFTTYEIPLSAAGWRLNDAEAGPEPTETQFLGVLSSLTALEMRAEFSTTKPETNALDNVRILQPQSVCDTYLQSYPDPAGVRLEWPVNALNFNLYGATNLTALDWTIVPTAPTETNGLNSVNDPLEGGQKFYLLRRP